jgi:lysozyme
MRTGPAGLALIKEFEGLKLAAYLDGAGVPTIGYGHTHEVSPGMSCTEAEADAWLDTDLLVAETGKRSSTERWEITDEP